MFHLNPSSGLEVRNILVEKVVWGVTWSHKRVDFRGVMEGYLEEGKGSKRVC